MSIFICRPPRFSYRAVMFCPNCQARRRIVVTLMGWYGTHADCCGCGASFDEGHYRLPKKNKKDETIAHAKELWKASTLSKKEAIRLDYEETVWVEEE